MYVLKHICKVFYRVSTQDLSWKYNRFLNHYIERYLKFGPVPWCVEVCVPLHVSILDLIGGVSTLHTDWELHFQELVTLMPFHLLDKESHTEV